MHPMDSNEDGNACVFCHSAQLHKSSCNSFCYVDLELQVSLVHPGPESNGKLTVNVSRATEMVDSKAIVFIDVHFFLICVTDRKIGYIFLAVNIWTRWLRHTPENTCFKWDLSFLCKVELSCHWTPNRHRVFCWNRNKTWLSTSS